LIELTIDGQKITVSKGKTVIEAALENSIDIPHLCYHPDLSISGACRLCIIEVEGQRFPKPSCGLECQNGMVITTQSEELYKYRREILDLLLSDHPLDCVACDQSGSCLIQKYAYEYDIKRTSYGLDISKPLLQEDNPFFIRDHQYCIMCGRCVRVCDEIVGASAIGFASRGFTSSIASPFNGPLIESTCVFCGSCIQVCPTAALMPVTRKGGGREWELERVHTICGYCGVGCQVEYALRDGKIIYAQSTPDAPVNGEFLCTKGRFGWDFSTNPERLTAPMIRRDLAYDLGLTSEPWELPSISPLEIEKPVIDHSHIAVDWDTALDLIAEKLALTVTKSGPDAVMGLSSARCTNEENYLFQKFMRAGIGTNNVDHCARL